jgi:hypothetical protein
MFFTASASPLASLHPNVSKSASLASMGDSSWYYREFVSSEKKIELALQAAELEAGEPRPSEQAIKEITRLVEVVSKTTPLASEADVSVFYGEAIVTWRSNPREVSVLSRGNNGAKLLGYVSGQDQQVESQVIENAKPEDLRQAIRWLYC